MQSQVYEAVPVDTPNVGLCVALSIGELSLPRLQQLRDSGAARYLLRIESSNPDLFQRIHPENQTFEQRLQCLQNIKAAGLQLGTGAQSARMLLESEFKLLIFALML